MYSWYILNNSIIQNHIIYKSTCINSGNKWTHQEVIDFYNIHVINICERHMTNM